MVDTDRFAPPSDLPQAGEAADRVIPFDEEADAWERAKARADVERRPWLSPMNRRRLDNFRRNKRGAWSLWIFLVLFVASLFAEFIANDRPLIASYKGEILFPVFVRLSRGQVRRLRGAGRFSRLVRRQRGQGAWLDDLAADPLRQLDHHPQSADPAADAADLDAERR